MCLGEHGCFDYGELRCDAVFVGLGTAARPRLEAAATLRRAYRDQWASKRGGRRHHSGVISLGAEFERDVLTAGAELAVARHYRLAWTAEKNPAAVDVGGIIEVRWRDDTRYVPDLTLRPGESGDRYSGPYVLVTGDLGCYVLRGWILGDDGRRREYLLDRGNGRELYYVPQSKLRNLRLLRTTYAGG